MWQITGHTKQVEFLRRGLERGHTAHAYLFVGLPHIGKMTLALNLAAALNCEGTEPPCGDCPSCLKTASGKHADVQVISLERVENEDEDEEESSQKTRISVKQIEDMQHAASLPPFEGRYKIFIIESAEYMSLNAANRLLKTIEEPEEKVLFILLTPNDRMLPETIVSRCQVVRLSPVPEGEIETILIRDHEVEPGVAKLLAKFSHGCPGLAVSAANDDSLLKSRGEWMDEILDVMDSDYEERFGYAARLATQFGKDRDVVYERLGLWLDLWRDLLLLKSGSVDTITNIDRAVHLSEMKDRYGLSRIRDFITNVMAADDKLRKNANPRMVLEVLMLDIPEPDGKTEAESAALPR